MYFSGWVDTSEPSTLDSSWIDSFAWHSRTVERDPSPDDRGTLVVWIRHNGELKKYSYNNESKVPYNLFNKLRLVAEHGEEEVDSVGKRYIELVKENDNIPPASVEGEEKTERTTPASER